MHFPNPLPLTLFVRSDQRLTPKSPSPPSGEGFNASRKRAHIYV